MAKTNHHNDNNNTVANDNISSTNIYQSVSSTELTQNSDPLKTTLPTLPNIYTPLPGLQRQNSLHFNTEPIILNNSTQSTTINIQNFQITPKQLVNLV